MNFIALHIFLKKETQMPSKVLKTNRKNILIIKVNMIIKTLV